MIRYQASSPEAQIIGQLCLTFSAAITHEEIKPILKEFGLDQIDPTHWYPQQTILDMLRAVATLPDGTQYLVAIGVKVVDYGDFPPELDTIEKALLALSNSYPRNHRNVPPGEGYEVNIVKPGSAHIKANVPYPDDLIYGAIWGFVRKLKAPGDSFRVQYLHNTTRPKDSDTPAEFEVKWGAPY
jgi:hypothetical protein